MTSRRDLLQKAMIGLPMVSVAALFAQKIKLPIVQKLKEWVEVPTFNNGRVLEADQLNALSCAIVELQSEVQSLKNWADKV